jgi:DNA-directed RNA polymerase specialized sigma24 family protein
LKSFRQDAKFSTWLTHADNVFLADARKIGTADAHGCGYALPSGAAERNLSARQAALSIDLERDERLSDAERAAIVQCYIMTTHEEAAEVLGCRSAPSRATC